MGSVQVESNLRFPGQYYDEETGLHYNWMRHYEPQLGRFTAKDPIDFAGGDTNLYAYVQNNTVNRVDPSGLYWFQQDWQAANPIVGREGHPIVWPGGPISSFVEKYVPAGRTLAEIHDPLVDVLRNAGVWDWLATYPTLIPAYVAAIALEVLRFFGIVEQPTPCE